MGKVLDQATTEMSKTTICLDFDGVIHSYTSKWVDAQTIPDRPVDGAKEFIEMLMDNDYEVAILSTRSKELNGRNAMKQWMNDWGFKGVDKLTFCDCKPPAIIYIDDRAFRFMGPHTWPSLAYIKNFKPWNKGADPLPAYVEAGYSNHPTNPAYRDATHELDTKTGGIFELVHQGHRTLLGVMWCNSHGRRATHWDKDKHQWKCDPKLGGILLPCQSQLMPISVLPNHG